MGGQKINDHSSWCGTRGQNSILPDGPHKTKAYSSAEGAGEVDRYEDTTEAIKATQEMAKRKLEGNKPKPGYRN
jgi:hypothetical protein